MSPNATKFVFQAVVLVMALYWIWPHMLGNTAATEAKKSVESPELTAAMLKPTFPPLPERNPFQSSRMASAEARTATSGKNDGTADGVKPIELVLNATCIVGNQRLAIINGQIYERKDTIGGTDAASSYMVADILSDKVCLEHQGKSMLLKYTDAAARKPDNSPTQSKTNSGALPSGGSGAASKPRASVKPAKVAK